jgi:hypothetical protein
MTGQTRLAALLILLGATAGAAYMLVPEGEPQRPAIARHGLHQPTPVKSRTEIVDGWKADILARPLIYPGRRAPAPAPAIADRNAQSDPPPRLTGVIVGPAARHALFTTGPGAKPVIVDEGGRIGPYTVRSILSNQVLVDGPGGIQSLQPTYEGAEPSAAPNPPSSPRHAAADFDDSRSPTLS